MMSRNMTLPEIGLIAGTRAALGAGIGLLLADRLDDDQRRSVGWTLVAVGVVTTFPLIAEVLCRHPSDDIRSERSTPGGQSGPVAGTPRGMAVAHS